MDPHQMNVQEAYGRLGLDVSASENVVDKKFKELAKKKHPYGGGDNAEIDSIRSCIALPIRV